MRFFPKDYQDAVTKFRQATAGLGGESGRWQVGSGLEVDHRYWPAKKERKTLFYLMSGVHGPETYAGHGIQMLFLREIFPKINFDKCGVLMVHSLNPYGFKHNRRCTEAGVNLNRNCSIYDDLYRIDNQASLQMAQRFLPAKPLASADSLLLQSLKRAGDRVHFDEVSIDEFIRSVCPGQFVSPEGLEFGGKGPEPQIRSLMARLKEIFPGYQDVVFLDLHTGLGHRGRLHMLTGDSAGCVHPEFFKEILDPKADADAYEYTPNDSPGFYPTHGSTNDMMSELMAPHQRLCALTMEFGTYGHDLDAQLKSLNIWLAEHQGGCFGYATPELEREIRAEHLNKFFPASEAWGESVLGASRAVFTRILKRAGHL
jgi:predicted deacylase